MSLLARKKIVLVIVEGTSDDVALGMALSQVYNKDSIYVQIMQNRSIIKQVILNRLSILLIQMEHISQTITL